MRLPAASGPARATQQQLAARLRPVVAEWTQNRMFCKFEPRSSDNDPREPIVGIIAARSALTDAEFQAAKIKLAAGEARGRLR